MPTWESSNHICTLEPNMGTGKSRQTLGSPQPGHLKERPRQGACSYLPPARLPWRGSGRAIGGRPPGSQAKSQPAASSPW